MVASLLPLSYSGRREAFPSRRRRALGLALAIALELLIVLALLTLGVDRPTGEHNDNPLSIVFLPGEKPTAPKPAAPATKAPRPAPAPPVRAALPPPRVKLPPRNHDLPMLVVSKEIFAAADIRNLGSKGVPGDSHEEASADDTARVGTAPNGEPLYAAEWVREPTDRELSGYLPPRMPDGGGWGLVACKTVAHYHVEDCAELGNSPPGSHLAGAVRQAAWQFLVRPPRVKGRELTGTWVRIRIDYLTAKE
jgi:protein TonB